MFGGFAPALVGFTDDVLFGQVWKRQELSPKECSLVTVASLTTSGNADHRLPPRPGQEERAIEEELIEAITHLAFYAGPFTLGLLGWLAKGHVAMAVAKQVFRGTRD